MKFLKACLVLSSASLLPLAAPAASLPVASGTLYGGDVIEAFYPHGFVGYKGFVVEMFLAPNADSGGFTAFAGVDTSVFSFLGEGVELDDYSAPDATGSVFFNYSGNDPYSSFMVFGPPDADAPDAVHVYMFGAFTALRLTGEAYPEVGQTLDLYIEFTLDTYVDPEEALAAALHDQLMAFTNGTGILSMNTTATWNGDGTYTIGSADLFAVPEPRTTAALLALAVLGAGLARRRLYGRRA